MADRGVSDNGHMPFVYFIQSVNGGPVKIGQSADPKKRLALLQVGHPEDLTIRRLIPDPAMLERFAHTLFGYAHIRGEWFEADEILERVMATGDVWPGESLLDVYDGVRAATASVCQAYYSIPAGKRFHAREAIREWKRTGPALQSLASLPGEWV